MPNPLDDFDRADPGARARLARFEALHELWQGIPADEILHDIGIGLQLAAYKHRQELIVADARVAVVWKGATHECSEWPGPDGRCLLCQRSL